MSEFYHPEMEDDGYFPPEGFDPDPEPEDEDGFLEQEFEDRINGGLDDAPEDDGQPTEWEEWQDVFGGDDSEYGTFGDYDHGDE